MLHNENQSHTVATGNNTTGSNSDAYQHSDTRIVPYDSTNIYETLQRVLSSMDHQSFISRRRPYNEVFYDSSIIPLQTKTPEQRLNQILKNFTSLYVFCMKDIEYLIDAFPDGKAKIYEKFMDEYFIDGGVSISEIREAVLQFTEHRFDIFARLITFDLTKFIHTQSDINSLLEVFPEHNESFKNILGDVLSDKVTNFENESNNFTTPPESPYFLSNIITIPESHNFLFFQRCAEESIVAIASSENAARSSAPSLRNSSIEDVD